MTPVPGTVVVPVQPTPLIDRQRDTERICDLLLSRDARLVTLVGPGGSGKTRLAIAVAEAVASTLPDGVIFIDLTNAPVAAEAEPTIARRPGIA